MQKIGYCARIPSLDLSRAVLYIILLGLPLNKFQFCINVTISSSYLNVPRTAAINAHLSLAQQSYVYTHSSFSSLKIQTCLLIDFNGKIDLWYQTYVCIHVYHSSLNISVDKIIAIFIEKAAAYYIDQLFKMSWDLEKVFFFWLIVTMSFNLGILCCTIAVVNIQDNIWYIPAFISYLWW